MILSLVEISFVIINYFQRYFNLRFYKIMVLNLKTSLIEETMKIKTKEIDKNSSGVFIDRLNKDTREIVDIFM